MTLKTWGSENPASADINGMFNECLIISGLNLIREMVDHDIDFSAGGFDWFGDAYIDANGRENSVDIDKNLTGAIFDTNKYKVPAFADETEYIIIEATSMGTWTNGDNNTYVNKIGVGKWIVWCDTGTDAVKRAQIHKSLWYGTNNTNQLILDFTTITSIQTSNANDVGKRAYNIYAHEANCLATNTVVGTFSSASDNAAVSSWSHLTVSEGGSGTTITWENPTGTILNNASSGGGNANELGTDREADETNNPATCKINITAHNGYNPRAWIIVLTAQTISWANTGFDTFTEIDFYTDNSIPVMIAVGAITAEVDYSPIVHTIPSGTFSSTMSSAIGVPFVEDWETGADIQYKLTGTAGAEDTGWLDAGITPEISSFTTFTDEPDTLIVKLVPKTTSPTAGTPSLRGFSIRAT